MPNWRIWKLALFLVLVVGLATADTGHGYHHGRRGADGDELGRARREAELGIQRRNANKPAIAVEDGVLPVRQYQSREGNDNMLAAPCTASSITQPTASSTIHERRATIILLPSTTPPPHLQPRQAIPLDPLGTISSLSAVLSSLSLSASSAIANISASASSAQSSAQSAISSVSSSASSSASVVMASLSASASSAVSSAASSAATSVSMALSSAWRAVESASRDVQSAKSEAAIVRAQGAVVPVTQAALGIVGAIIGSSILSILAFYCVMRWRKQKKRKRMAMSHDRKPSIGYPQTSPLNGPDLESFTATSTQTVHTPRKLQSTRSRSMTADSAPARMSRIDTSRVSKAPRVLNNSPGPLVDPGFSLSGTTAVGYTASGYASQEWPIFPEQPDSGNTTMARTPSSASSTPNFSRRHTRADSAPSNILGRQGTESVPTTDSTYVPGHSRSGSTSTLGGIGVGGDLRSPLRRNVVSLFPRPRDGGGIVLVRPENLTSSNGGMKDAPLPPPPLFNRIDRLSRVSEEPGLAHSTRVPPLELEENWKVCPFEWP